MNHTATSVIPKEMFPSLLKSASERMDNVQSQSKHKPSDFEFGVKRNPINATSICPFNRFKVLDKVPDIGHDPRRSYQFGH
nr:unnamed protein product [Callosobruchus analis]